MKWPVADLGSIGRSYFDACFMAGGSSTSPRSEKGPGAELVVWARLIKPVYEVDPQECPDCGGAMRSVSFIERCQSDVFQ